MPRTTSTVNPHPPQQLSDNGFTEVVVLSEVRTDTDTRRHRQSLTIRRTLILLQRSKLTVQVVSSAIQNPREIFRAFLD